MYIKDAISELVRLGYKQDEKSQHYKTAEEVDDWLNSPFCPLTDKEEL